MPFLPRSLVDRWNGLRFNWKFTNRWALLTQRLFFRNEPIVTYHWKNRWLLVCDTRYADHYSPQSLLAEQEYGEWLRACSRQGACSYVNIGAHIGGFDIAVLDAAGSVPYALCVELNPRTFAALQYNLAVNALVQVRALHAGIAGERGRVRFSASSCSLADSIFSSDNAADPAAIELPLLTLEDALRQHDFLEREFDLLKIDCEGAEYSIVRLTPASVLRQFRHLIMEIHPPPAGENYESLAAKLRDCGFTIVEEQAEPRLLFWKRHEA